MTRFPYMPYYVMDITAATAAMTDEQFGAYQRLLNYAWLHDGLPADEQEIREIRRWTTAAWARIWPAVSRKWISRDGRLINERQEQERINVQRRSDVGRVNAARRWQSNGNATALPLDCKPDGSSKSNTNTKKDPADAGSSRASRATPPLIQPMRGDIAYPWRVPLPGRLWAELKAKIGGSEEAAERTLDAWVRAVIARYPAGQPIPDAADSWAFWRRQSVSLFPAASPPAPIKTQQNAAALAAVLARHGKGPFDA